MFRKMRPVLIVFGLALVIGSIIGARELTHNGSGDANANGKSADTGPRSAGVLVVLGFVDTDPGLVQYGLPPILQSGTITKVHVKEGNEVKVDQPLYEFDATIQNRDVEQAIAAVAYANTKVKEAEELAKQHAANIKFADKAVEAAERKVGLTKQYYELVEKNLETFYRTEKIPETEWKERKKSDTTLYKANVDYDTAIYDLNQATLKRDQLKAVDPLVKVKEAQASVKQAEAAQAKAQSAVDLCVVRAKTAGIIEQVTIGPGTTLGVASRTPALWLIPTGPRIVRAEVEAEFAHRVGPSLEGKVVTVTDHTDPKLTYAGTVRRIPPVFMLKRNTDGLLGNDTRVIEVVVEVPDHAPANKPPLRVGQRVRVTLGQ